MYCTVPPSAVPHHDALLHEARDVLMDRNASTCMQLFAEGRNLCDGVFREDLKHMFVKWKNTMCLHWTVDKHHDIQHRLPVSVPHVGIRKCWSESDSQNRIPKMGLEFQWNITIVWFPNYTGSTPFLTLTCNCYCFNTIFAHLRDWEDKRRYLRALAAGWMPIMTELLHGVDSSSESDTPD